MHNNNSIPSSVRQVFDSYMDSKELGRSDEAEIALREAVCEMASASPQFAALVLSGASGETCALVIAAALGFDQLEVASCETTTTVTHTDHTLFGFAFSSDVRTSTTERKSMRSHRLRRSR